MGNWIDRVLEAAVAQRLIVLVGAGTSMGKPCELPGWPGLIEEMACHAESFQPSRARLMRDEKEQGNLLGAAEIYAQDDRIPKPQRADFFLKRLDTTKEVMPRVYKILASLPARHWVTTNFDNNLRHALDLDKIEILSNGQLSTFLSLWGVKQFGLYLHGRGFEYESLVYHSSQFAQLQKNSAYREVIKRLVLQSTILAYGYSFSDPDFLSIVNYIIEELGGAPAHSHVVLTATPQELPADQLRRAGFEIVRYSPKNDHAEGLALLKEVGSRAKALAIGPARSLPVAKENELRMLVGLYHAVSNDRSSAYGNACAALLVSALSPNSWTARSDLRQRISQRAHVPISNAEHMIQAGLDALAAGGTVAEICEDRIRLATQISDGFPEISPILTAIETRLSTYRSYTPTAVLGDQIRSVISYVMMAQGMAVAKSFANQESPEAYALDVLVKEAVFSAGIGAHLRNDLHRCVVEVLADPDLACSRLLFRLAHAAYALESVFLNPLESDLGEVLNWRLYLDSNVVMRLLSPAALEYRTLRGLIDRLRRLGTPIVLLHPLAEEIIGHAQQQARILRERKITSGKDLASYLAGIPPRERSPFMTWYLAHVERSGWWEFSRFARHNCLDTVGHLGEQMKRLGIELEGGRIIRDLDISERETLWDALRKWRGGEYSVTARRLRRAEATQMEYLLRLRRGGVRSWFLSIDGQLRGALKFVEGGKYAGFVMTPTAWAHRLADLHWGEVDFAGFSEMMWSLPARSAKERLADVTIRRVLEKSGYEAGISPEWLRDRVEDAFKKLPVDDFLAGDECEQAETFDDLVAQLVPPAASRILDELARRQSSAGTGRRSTSNRPGEVRKPGKELER